MAVTNFGLLTANELTAWSREFWELDRNRSFATRFMGKGPNAMIQNITELTKTKKGARAILTLLTDLEGDGVVGDRTLEGNEEALKSQDVEIKLDMIRNASRHEGKMAEQRSVVNFREQVRDKLSYWIADRIDQMAFLTLAGLSPALGDYSVAHSRSMKLLDGAIYTFRCPLCRVDLTSNVDDKLVELLSRSDEDDSPVRVSFSRIHGEHATFLVADSGVDRFGEHAGRYATLNFLGEAKRSDRG